MIWSLGNHETAATAMARAGRGWPLYRGWASAVTRHLLCWMLVSLLPLWAATAALAQSSDGAYITPFPKSDVYKLRVYGDYFAEGLAYGLADSFKSDKRISVERSRKRIRSLVQSKFDRVLNRHLEELGKNAAPIVVIMLGGNDWASIRYPGGAKVRLNTPAWRRAYGARIDKLIQGFKSKGSAVYWVGLPVLRRRKANRNAKTLNEIMRERVYLNGARFIDIYSAFADEDGKYDVYGPDLTGKIRKLRDGDGETFTAAGNRKLAHFVEREIKRDLVQAKAERAVPLAGAKDEQERINPQRQRTETAEGWDANVAHGDKTAKGAKGRKSRGRRRIVRRGPLDQKADNSRVMIELVAPSGSVKKVAVEILRPAIPASIISLVTRKESSNKASEIGDAVPGILQGGLTVLSTITPARDNLNAGGHRRLPPTHTLYYRVLVKGETLPPMPGRSDDFRWPRRGESRQGAKLDAAPIR